MSSTYLPGRVMRTFLMAPRPTLSRPRISVKEGAFKNQRQIGTNDHPSFWSILVVLIVLIVQNTQKQGVKWEVQLNRICLIAGSPRISRVS